MTLATAEQMAALTVPATLPWVVRCGTPLRIDMPHGETVDGVVVHQRGDVWAVAVSLEADDIHHVFPRMRLRDVHAVDLTDATGRAHVAWAIGAALGSATAVWGRTNVGWAIMLDDGSTRNYCAQISPLSEDCHCGNNTRLPDGSRLVDALALKAVAMHVLGGGR